MIRRSVYYSGRVQGVGFRWTVHRIAQKRDVAGYVRNLDDGRVELVVEGLAEELDLFMKSIAETMESNIDNIETFESEASIKFKSFSIQH